MNKSDKINCFLIGAQKAGSTTLYSWLSQHPEIDAPDSIKDFHFFTSNEYSKRGYDWFETLYRKKNAKIKLNGAVNYLFRAEAPEKVFSYNPNAKFIVILRNPVKRAFSAYNYFFKLDKETRTFPNAIYDELKMPFRNLEEKDDFAYLEHGYYYSQLLNWIKLFGREKFLILIYEDFFSDPKKHLKKVFQFLKLNSDFSPQLQKKNVSGVVKFKHLNRLIYHKDGLVNKFVNKTRLKHLFPLRYRGWVKSKFRDWNTKKNSDSPKLSIERYTELEKWFVKQNDELSNFLEIDLKDKWFF